MSTIDEEHLGVVIVDDDPIFREIICATLRKTSLFVIFEAGSGDELVALLKQQSIDCIVLDYDLGMETGFTVKQRIEASSSERVPIVMLTGDGRESTAIRAFRMGVADYVPKRGLNSENLIRTVQDAVRRSRRERSEDADRRRLLAASSTDATTGLEGRTRLDERLRLLYTMPAGLCSNYGLILIEIADYEGLTGRFGFKVADQALKAVAIKLSALTRSGDVCGRYEDGTFLVIADVQADQELLSRICSRFAEQLVMRLTSDTADLQLMVQVAAALAAPISSEAKSVGSWHPALMPASLAMDGGRGSAMQVTIAAGPVRALEPREESRAVSPIGGNSEATASRPAAEEFRSEDRRKHPRQRVFRKGLIHFIDKPSTINCTVRSHSLAGMGLRLDIPCAVPDTFDLEVLGSGTKMRVRVRWQSSKDIGVEVVRSADVKH